MPASAESEPGGKQDAEIRTIDSAILVQVPIHRGSAHEDLRLNARLVPANEAAERILETDPRATIDILTSGIRT